MEIKLTVTVRVHDPDPDYGDTLKGLQQNVRASVRHALGPEVSVELAEQESGRPEHPGQPLPFTDTERRLLAPIAGELWAAIERGETAGELREYQCELLNRAAMLWRQEGRARPKNTYFVLVSPDPDDLGGSEVIEMCAPDAYTAAGRAFDASGHPGWFIVAIMDSDGGDYTATPLLANIDSDKARRVYRKMGRH